MKVDAATQTVKKSYVQKLKEQKSQLIYQNIQKTSGMREVKAGKYLQSKK